jgi:hypothetical protein
MHVRYRSRQDEAIAAAERASVAAEYRQAIQLRQKAGLETPDTLAAASEEERSASIQLARLRNEGQSALSTLLRLCGLHTQPRKAAELLLVARNEVRP